jgi:hypothetical protein
VQHRGGGKVERVAGVSQAAGDLATVEKSWSWAERVAVVPDPGQDLAGVREGRAAEPVKPCDLERVAVGSIRRTVSSSGRLALAPLA